MSLKPKLKLTIKPELLAKLTALANQVPTPVPPPAPLAPIVPLAPSITLYDYQVEHETRIRELLQYSPFAFDFSMLGTGKTYTTSYMLMNNLGRQYQTMIVVCPVTVKNTWSYMINTYRVPIAKMLSFCELRTVKFKQPKHGLLTRRDYMTTVRTADGRRREIEKVDYKCTSAYLDLVRDGVLLIIDEMQNVKNISNQLDACQELIRPIIEGFDRTPATFKSRVLLLSGSPSDKQHQAVHFFRLLNIMTSDRLAVYNPQTYQIMWRGMSEIENYCRRHFDEDEVTDIHDQFTHRFRAFGGSRQESILNEYCYQLFRNCLRKYCSHSMNPIHIDSTITKQNGYYYVNNQTDIELLVKGITGLGKSTRFNPDNQTIDFGHDGIGALRAITQSLMMIETAKISLFTRIASQNLDRTPNQKVVICVNYTATIVDLMATLSRYHPLRLDGQMTSRQRTDVLTRFQDHSANYRLLIGNISVCSTGIDLDDQDGRFPRLCLVSPNYNTIQLYQLSHRFHRINTRSDSTIHFVLGKERSELPILNALARKSSVLKEMTPNQVEHGVIFPGDYPRWDEPAPL
jgi:hypothetical protein